MVKFHFLTGDINWLQYGGKWISNKQNNEEFNYWLILEFINFFDATGELNDNSEKYVVELRAVSPEQISKENIKAAFKSCGYDNQDKPYSEEQIIEIIDSYGIHAVLQSKWGNNGYKLIREMKRESQFITRLFGFYMDRRENRIGQTGWDLIRGQSIREFLGIDKT